MKAEITLGSCDEARIKDEDENEVLVTAFWNREREKMELVIDLISYGEQKAEIIWNGSSLMVNNKKVRF